MEILDMRFDSTFECMKLKMGAWNGTSINVSNWINEDITILS